MLRELHRGAALFFVSSFRFEVLGLWHKASRSFTQSCTEFFWCGLCWESCTEAFYSNEFQVSGFKFWGCDTKFHEVLHRVSRSFFCSGLCWERCTEALHFDGNTDDADLMDLYWFIFRFGSAKAEADSDGFILFVINGL